jgi:hypothetical protein
MVNVKPNQISFAIGKVLQEYNANVVKGVNAASEKAAKSLKRVTQEKAPRKSGKFRRDIDCKELERKPTGNIWIWYVKTPRHRLTHLLAKGHRKANGKGMTKANDFLEYGISKIEPEYEADIEKAARGEQI